MAKTSDYNQTTSDNKLFLVRQSILPPNQGLFNVCQKSEKKLKLILNINTDIQAIL